MNSEPLMVPTLVVGNILDQDVEVIVNPWNRNVIPWWLLLPQGVSAAIRRRAGNAPFKELSRAGPIPLGGAVLTSAGRLPFRAIIHVAGIDLLWRSSEEAVRASVNSAMSLVKAYRFESIAFPLIGAGTGGLPPGRSLSIMQETFLSRDIDARVVLVKFDG